MTTNVSHADYWQQRYEQGKAGWDMGRVSPPLKAYFDNKFSQVAKTAHILIAGAGNAYEAEYLHNQGFSNVIVVDFAQTPLTNLANKLPNFPKEHLVQSDFFLLDTDYQRYRYEQNGNFASVWRYD